MDNTIKLLQPTKKHYLSFFKWILFLLIVIYHSLYLFTSNAFLATLAHKIYDYIPFLVDCFFVMSGFLMARAFCTSHIETGFYIRKRLVDFVPILVLFWFSFFFIGKLGWMKVDLIKGLPDLFGLSIFGAELVHNQLNYTWFLYTLFWCNIFLFLILKLKKFAPFVLIPILITTGVIISSYWIEGNVISPKPYENLPISFGLLRGIFASTIGVLVVYPARFTPSFIRKSPYLFQILGLIEAIIFILSILMFSQLSPKEIYINGLSLFGLLLFSLSFENSPLCKVLNQKYFSYGSNYLLGGYIFSAITLSIMAHVLQKHPYLTTYGDSVYIAVILISLLFGAIIYHTTKKIQSKI